MSEYKIESQNSRKKKLPEISGTIIKSACAHFPEKAYVNWDTLIFRIRSFKCLVCEKTGTTSRHGRP